MGKLPSEILIELPAGCWCCGEMTTQHVWGVSICAGCFSKNYDEDEDQLFKDIETEMESW